MLRRNIACLLSHLTDAPGESIWLYVPDSHKTEHHGQFRAVPIMPVVQRLLDPLLRRAKNAFLFCPIESMQQFREKQRIERKTKVQPSQLDRSKASPKKKPGRKYQSNEYRKAIERACERVNERRAKAKQELISNWFPHQLRHAASAAVADAEGNLRGSQALLGHASPRTTEGYAKLSFRGAVSAAARLIEETGAVMQA